MNDAFFKPSLNVESFIGENSSVNTERFLLFIKAYYEWMQSTTLSLTNKTETFVVGETIVGATSGAIGSIKEVKTNSIIIAPTSRTVFAYAESITGQTSGAIATISIIKDNVGRASGNILNYKNVETSIDKYVDYLREELYPSIPLSYYGDKKLIAQYFKDFYESKSNEQSYRFLFKLLYNEDIDFYYPGEDILRVSDGNFEKTQIIRTLPAGTGTLSDVFLFLNKTIRGQTSGVLANVVDIKKFFIGSLEVAEMTLKLVSGTFAAGENIVDIDNDNLTTTIYGIVSGITVIDGGSGYQVDDIITISGTGSEAQAKVSSIKESPISALKVNTVGHGYQLNTEATINNSGTGGTGFIFKVSELANTYTVTSGANTYTVGEISRLSVINRGEGYFKKPSITLQDTTIASLGLLSNNLITISNAGTNYGVGNTLIFTGGAGANAAGQIASVVETTTFDLLFEDGFQMKADGSYYDIIKNEDWLVKGPIKRIELTNFGTGYTSANLPSITISTTTGASANLVATNIQGKSANVSVDTSNNITGIGSIRSVEITNFGINYTTANASASAVGDGNANVAVTISGLGIKEGVLLNDDGKIDYKIIQDSYYYQDFSYVIRSGLVFSVYKDTLKSIIHPAGLQTFGEILIKSVLDVTPIISSTISSLASVNEYIVDILSAFNISSDIAQSKYTMIMPSTADTSSSLLESREVQVHIEPSVLQAESTFDRTLEILTKDEFDLSHDISKQYILRIPSIDFFAYETTYGDLIIGDYADTPISTFSAFSFDSFFTSDPNVSSTFTRYVPFTGTISSSANTITGTGTNFVTEFPVGTNLVVNNQLFIVKSVANSTYMTINVNPTAPLVGATGYRVPIPTYSFSSVPASINEGANGTFNVATTFVDSGTTLYWTIDNVTTNSGDFA
jgi:hypothetical protein